MTDRLLSIKEATHYLRQCGLTDLNDKWISDQMSRGKIPFSVIAKKRRIRSDVLEKFVDQMFLDATNTNYSSKRTSPETKPEQPTQQPQVIVVQEPSFTIPRRLQSAKRLALLDSIFTENK